MFNNRRFWQFLHTLTFAFFASNSYAVEYKLNGFLTAAAGIVVAAEKDFPAYEALECPCFITDYNQGGVYQDSKGLSAKSESRAGIQILAEISPTLSFTAQSVYRTIDHDATIEWAYASYNFFDDWTVSLGRKRLPIYFYSDFQDIGNAYIFIRPPQTLYGWEVSNFNGGTLRYQSLWNEYSIDASIFAGEEEVEDSEYQTIYDSIEQNSKWKNILGLTFEINRDWLTARLMYISSDNYVTMNDETTLLIDANVYNSDYTLQKIMGVAVNADFGDWFILSEYNINKRNLESKIAGYKAPNATLGFGYRWNKFTYFLNYSRYWEESIDETTYEPERYIDKSLTLRYDINANSDVKLQIDAINDESVFDFVGDTTVITVAYDRIF